LCPSGKWSAGDVVVAAADTTVAPRADLATTEMVPPSWGDSENEAKDLAKPTDLSSMAQLSLNGFEHIAQTPVQLMNMAVLF